MIWWIFRGVFSKNVDGWKRFLMILLSASKNWIYIIDQEMKSGFLGSGSELFLADQQGEDCWNDSFVIVGWWIMLWKRRVSDVSLEISANVEVPIDFHSVRSEAKSQNLIVILRIVKSILRIYLENPWWILQLWTRTSSVQNNALDGRKWIKGP